MILISFLPLIEVFLHMFALLLWVQLISHPKDDDSSPSTR
jgi:hypothetical protein